MNWIRQTLKYFGRLSSPPDEQLLEEEFNEEDLCSKHQTDTLTTIKNFTQRYPISISSACGDDLTQRQNEHAISIDSHNEEITADLPANHVSNEMEPISLHNEEIEDLITSSSVCDKTMEDSLTKLSKSDYKKSDRVKKVRKRVTWAVRRSWKWIKRGWAGYAPGAGAGLMYFSNAPTTVFEVYRK